MIALDQKTLQKRRDRLRNPLTATRANLRETVFAHHSGLPTTPFALAPPTPLIVPFASPPESKKKTPEQRKESRSSRRVKPETEGSSSSLLEAALKQGKIGMDLLRSPKTPSSSDKRRGGLYESAASHMPVLRAKVDPIKK